MTNLSQTLIQIFIIASLLCIAFLGYVVLKQGKAKINKIFFFLMLILNFWMIGTFMMFNASSAGEIIFWDRFIYLGIVFWPVMQYHFSLAATKQTKKRQLILYFGYIASFFFLIISRTNYFLKDVFYYKWGAHAVAQTFHDIFMIFFLIYVILFLFNLLRHRYLIKSRTEKEKLLHYIIGFATLNIIGLFGFLPAYKLSIYPIFLIAPLIFALIIAYSIAYIGLLNIKLTIRSYSVYIFSLLTLLLPSYLIIYLSYHYFSKYLLFIFTLVFLSSLFIFSRVRNYYYLLSNKYLFSSLYDFNDLIYTLNNSLHSTLDVNQMFKQVIRILSKAFNSKKILILYYDKKDNEWQEVGKNKLKKSSLEIKSLKSIENIIGQDDFIPLKEVSIKKNIKSDFLANLIELKIDLVVPIKHRNSELQALILFGSKISGESYNVKDKQVLSLTASAISVSLENISLYENVKKFNYKLKEEIKRATIKLAKQNKELKQLDKLKDEFIGIASHQLRTPLTSIRWFTEILINRKKKNKRASKDELNILVQINDSNLKMIKLVNDLLDVSHIETGRKFKIVKKKLNIYDIISEVIAENSYLINKKELVIDNSISRQEMVEADASKLKQVLQNLISNASKYGFENSVIKIYAKNIKRKRCFCVEDQGIGIPKNQQKKLFIKFFRANNAAKQFVEGTGLGLYIAREIIRAHGGELYFKSTINKGSTFYFYLS